jgi:hypothetical protein
MKEQLEIQNAGEVWLSRIPIWGRPIEVTLGRKFIVTALVFVALLSMVGWGDLREMAAERVTDQMKELVHDDINMWPPPTPERIVANTIHDWVPFVSLSIEGYYGTADSQIRKALEAGLTRYFGPNADIQSDRLNKGTRYVPRLKREGDLRSVSTIIHGSVKCAIVDLIARDGTEIGFGVIPVAEYEAFLKSIGK